MGKVHGALWEKVEHDFVPADKCYVDWWMRLSVVTDEARV